MKITLLGPAHPYRGGLATIIQRMARIFAQRGNDVRIKTFTLQYPSFLFPGQSQTVTDPKPEDLAIERCVNTINPLNWLREGWRIRREKPDMVLLKYWTPFMSPSLGTIARISRANKHTKFICQIDNITPHEGHIVDKPLNRFFLNSMDGFVYMSEAVGNELRDFGCGGNALFSPHPLFESYGVAVSRTEATTHLGLDSSYRYMLFFGFIRDYKGLDLLLDAWGRIKGEHGELFGKTKLLVVGEFYAPKQPYLDQVERLGIGDAVIFVDKFVADEDVKYYFSAADVVVQNYKTATQSGVTQIAYNFDVPMIVTNVGGLAEIVPHDKVGYVTGVDEQQIAEAIVRIFEGDTLERMRRNIATEKCRFSWDAMCDTIEQVYRNCTE